MEQQQQLTTSRKLKSINETRKRTLENNNNITYAQKRICSNATSALNRLKTVEIMPFMTTFDYKRYTFRMKKIPTEIGSFELIILLTWCPSVEESEWRIVLQHVAQMVENDKSFFLGLNTIESVVLETHIQPSLITLIHGWTLLVQASMYSFRWLVAGSLSVYLELDVFTPEEIETHYCQQNLKQNLKQETTRQPNIYAALIRLTPKSMIEPMMWAQITETLYNTTNKTISFRSRTPPYNNFVWDPECCSLEDSLCPMKQPYSIVLEEKNNSLFNEIQDHEKQFPNPIKFSDVISDRIYYRANFHLTNQTTIHMKGIAIVGHTPLPLM
jgi:hypothetical protein